MFANFARGASISFATVSLPQFLAPNNTRGIVMNEEEASWYGKPPQGTTVIVLTTEYDFFS